MATTRQLHEVVELVRDCELGKKGERAMVLTLELDRYMTLFFANRPKGTRVVNTGADYAYLVTADGRKEL